MVYYCCRSGYERWTTRRCPEDIPDKLHTLAALLTRPTFCVGFVGARTASITMFNFSWIAVPIVSRALLLPVATFRFSTRTMLQIHLHSSYPHRYIHTCKGSETVQSLPWRVVLTRTEGVDVSRLFR